MKEFSYGFFRICLTLIVVPTHVFSRPKYAWFQLEPKEEPICKTVQCVKRSKEIANYLDHTVDPCTNFYQYACGGWQKNNPIPPSKVMWNIESIFDRNSLMIMLDLLEKPVTPKDSVNLKKAKQHYQTCRILPNLSKLDMDEVRNYVTKAGPWPIFSHDKKKVTSSVVADIHYFYFRLSSDGGLFDVDITVDSQDNYKPLLEVKALHSPYGLIQREGKWKNEWMQQYMLFLTHLVLKVHPDKSPGISEKMVLNSIKDVFTFRRKLVEAVGAEVLDPNAYHPLTLKEFQRWFDSIVQAQDHGKLCTITHQSIYILKYLCPVSSHFFFATAVPQINWLKTLNALFVQYEEAFMTLNTRINVKHHKYFEALAVLLGTEPPEVIANHLHLYFVERHLRLDEKLNELLSNLIVHNGESVGWVRHLDERWERCIWKSGMIHAIDEMYISKQFVGKAQKDTSELTNEMREIIKMHVSDSPWLDEESKKRARARIDSMKINIGLPDFYFNIMKQKKTEVIEPKRVHAFYSVDTNRIFISASYLQSPMYTEGLPYVINYATIGMLIAHEIYHIFDKTGITYEIYPKEPLKSLWPENIVQMYEKKSKCIVDQYNRPLQELEDVHRAPRNDGLRTFNENFADLMAMRSSYEAYKKRLLQENRVCPILPHLKNVNCDKLFFISYAVTFCANVPKWGLIRTLQKKQHSPPELRVNIPVANMPEFNHAFNCKKDSYENSVKRCYLWD